MSEEKKETTQFSFGSAGAFTFGKTGTGTFGAGTDNVAAAQKSAEGGAQVGGTFVPKVTLAEKDDLKTNEEDEDILWTERARLFRFDKEINEWAERGLGPMNILKHKQSGLIRVLMRRERVFKVCCNHYPRDYMKLKPMASSDRAWTWTCLEDYAYTEEDQREQLFAIRFANSDHANAFKTQFEQAIEANEKIKGGEKESEEKKEEAAEGEKKEEEKKE